MVVLLSYVGYLVTMVLGNAPHVMLVCYSDWRSFVLVAVKLRVGWICGRSLNGKVGGALVVNGSGYDKWEGHW